MELKGAAQSDPVVVRFLNCILLAPDSPRTDCASLQKILRAPPPEGYCLMQEAEPQGGGALIAWKRHSLLIRRSDGPGLPAGGRRDESNDEKIYAIDVGPDSRGRR